MQAIQCKAKTKSGKRCQAHAGADGFCFFHSPAMAADRAKAHKRGGQSRQIAKATEGQAAPVIGDVAGVLALVNGVIADVWALENSCPRARALLSAAAEARSTLTAGELETRLAALESVLKNREAK